MRDLLMHDFTKLCMVLTFFGIMTAEGQSITTVGAEALNSMQEVSIIGPTANVEVYEGYHVFSVYLMTLGEITWNARVSPGAPWVQIVWGATGRLPGTWLSHNNLITIHYEANPTGGEERTATIIVDVGPYVNGSPIILTVTQAANPGNCSCAMVYDLSMNLQTTAARRDSIAVNCAPDRQVCYRVPARKQIKGVLATCACTCEAFRNARGYIWDVKTKHMYASNQHMDWQQLMYIGKSKDEVEAFWKFEDVFTFMGFGHFDVHHQRISSLSGNVFCFLPSPTCEEECLPRTAAPGYDLCTLEVSPFDVTIAYGSWALKYNKTASKRYAEDNSYLCELVPVAP
jgi:hypothetical protein